MSNKQVLKSKRQSRLINMFIWYSHDLTELYVGVTAVIEIFVIPS